MLPIASLSHPARNPDRKLAGFSESQESKPFAGLMVLVWIDMRSGQKESGY